MATNPHPGNDYYVQPTTGTIQRQDNPFAVIGLRAAGFQGPMSYDEAKIVANSYRKVTQQKNPTVEKAASAVSDPLGSWLKSAGGAIGSGIEGAFVAFLKDLWDVILGPLEVLAGVALAILILAFAFKDDLAAVAMAIK